VWALADRHVVVAAPVVAAARPKWAWPPAVGGHRDRLAPPPLGPPMPGCVDAAAADADADADADAAADVDADADADADIVADAAPAWPSLAAHSQWVYRAAAVFHFPPAAKL